MRQLKGISFLLLTILLTTAAGMAKDQRKQKPIRPRDHKGGVKVACVGDSITYGYKLKNRVADNYPKQLGALLGKRWTVKNYGVSGMAALRKTQNKRSYWDTKEYQQALADQPHAVIIMLGTNDQWQRNWTVKASQDEFKKDYGELVDSFLKLKSKPRIWLCLPIPIQPETVVKNAQLRQVIDLIKEIAKAKKLPTIDLYATLSGKGEMYADSLHPNARGAKEVAVKISQILTGKKAKKQKRKPVRR